MPLGSHTLEIGSEAPSITLSSSSTTTLDSLDGKQILVNFWSASDPSSRISNSRLSRIASSYADKDVKFVSICIDSDPALAQEIAGVDGISDNVLSLNASDVAEDVLTDYQIATGCRSFLIDAYGNLKAIATSPSELAEILS